MSSYVLGFQDIDKSALTVVGGKGANLGELAKVDGIRVPDGVCITTDAYKRMIGEAPSLDGLLDRLSHLKAEDRAQIQALSAEIRRVIEGIAIPGDLVEAIAPHLVEGQAYAVRSSATAEDLPTASFAGQQDTYLNVIGQQAILQSISQCWASLFTERAVMYRIQHGFDHRKVQLAVVVQKMLFPQVAGVLFTADPVTSNRKVSSIDASFGLGEALVAGLVNADSYKVRDGRILEKKVATKKLEILALAEGGTQERAIEPELQHRQALTDEQIVRLERIGRAIEGHFGCPQDIEWCLVDDAFHVVQSRPITTLYPIPETNDQEAHVFVSTAHQQMMTDAMKPLGLSFFQMTAGRPMYTAGGRLFVDIASDMASPARRKVMVGMWVKMDPLIGGALTTLLERGDLIPLLPEGSPEPILKQPMVNFQAQVDNDPSIVTDLMTNSQAAIEALKRDIQAKSGVALFEFLREDMQQRRQLSADPRHMGAVMTGMNAAMWLNEKMGEWLGEKSVADTLAQSAPNNVTSEMGLALLDVADAIRPHPAVMAYLQQVEDDGFLEGLDEVEGGRAAREAIAAFLDKYGMRCAGEIDITKPRWAEKPTTLVPLILSNIKNFEPGAGSRKFEQGRALSLKKEQELLARLKDLPDGERKAEETREKISVLRNFTGYREYPKYGIVSRYFVYKQALWKEAERLALAGMLEDKEDVAYLTFEEFEEAVRSQRVDPELIRERKDAFRLYEKLTPPRVITSEGEIVTGAYRRDNLPADALVGLAVSAGVVEGRARVLLTMEEADLEEGDILVTAFTDPSWTPLFVSLKGLVTEVGGLMTHGAVIAREYGLPAVVSLENATRLIKDGQRIRVNGTDGYVELL